MNPIGEEEIIYIIRKIKNGEAIGVDEIPAEILKF